MCAGKLVLSDADKAQRDELWRKEREIRERIRSSKIPMPQSDGSTVMVTPFELLRELDAAIEDIHEFYRQHIE